MVTSCVSFRSLPKLGKCRGKKNRPKKKKKKKVQMQIQVMIIADPDMFRFCYIMDGDNDYSQKGQEH